MIKRMSILHVLPDFIALCPEAGNFHIIGERACRSPRVRDGVPIRRVEWRSRVETWPRR